MDILADFKPEESPMRPEAAELLRRNVEKTKRGETPSARCLPHGLPRTDLFNYAPFKMIQTPRVIAVLYEADNTYRQIYTDGRKLPVDPQPAWGGYSVGKWEGDTLVVTTTGFDDRQWVDQFGYPISDKATLEERWTRPSPNRLRIDMTLTDPETYTRPWHASPKIWALIPKEAMSIGGWSGILEDRCIPSDESLFNKFRDAAAGKR
jgi:hypothetical protein